MVIDLATAEDGHTLSNQGVQISEEDGSNSFVSLELIVDVKLQQHQPKAIIKTWQYTLGLDLSKQAVAIVKLAVINFELSS